MRPRIKQQANSFSLFMSRSHGISFSIAPGGSIIDWRLAPANQKKNEIWVPRRNHTISGIKEAQEREKWSNEETAGRFREFEYPVSSTKLFGSLLLLVHASSKSNRCIESNQTVLLSNLCIKSVYASFKSNFLAHYFCSCVLPSNFLSFDVRPR